MSSVDNSTNLNELNIPIINSKRPTKRQFSDVENNSLDSSSKTLLDVFGKRKAISHDPKSLEKKKQKKMVPLSQSLIVLSPNTTSSVRTQNNMTSSLLPGTPVESPKSDIVSKVEDWIEENSKIRISKPKLSLASWCSTIKSKLLVTLEEYHLFSEKTSQFKKLNPNTESLYPQDSVLVAAIGDVWTLENEGNVLLFWKIYDLKSTSATICISPSMYNKQNYENWQKLSESIGEGHVIAVLNPGIISSSDSKGLLLNISSAHQFLVLGQSPDLDFCSFKKNLSTEKTEDAKTIAALNNSSGGSNTRSTVEKKSPNSDCPNYVDIRRGTLCEYHSLMEIQHFSKRPDIRGTVIPGHSAKIDKKRAKNAWKNISCGAYEIPSLFQIQITQHYIKRIIVQDSRLQQSTTQSIIEKLEGPATVEMRLKRLKQIMSSGSNVSLNFKNSLHPNAIPTISPVTPNVPTPSIHVDNDEIEIELESD